MPVLAHFGTRDKSVPLESSRRLVAELERAGAPLEAHFYEAGHAFFDDTRPEVYNREAACLAWDRTLAFLRKHVAER